MAAVSKIVAPTCYAQGLKAWLFKAVHPNAVRVVPPCLVTRGRQMIFTVDLENALSVALLDHT